MSNKFIRLCDKTRINFQNMKKHKLLMGLLFLLNSLYLYSQTLQNTTWKVYDTSGKFFNYSHFGNDTLSSCTDNIKYEIVSSFSLNGNSISFHDVSSIPCHYVPGLYTCNIGNDTLRFYLTNDSCSSRVMVLTTYHWKSFPVDIPVNEDAENSISVFPNPTRDIITIKVEKQLINSEFSVTDVYGRPVIKGKLEFNSILHLENLPQGIYLLRIGRNLHSTIKLIKI